MESWNGIPLIKSLIDHYDVELVVEKIFDEELIIRYRGVWYLLVNNGGEINVEKINASESRPFPTVYMSESLNAETLMYRLFAVLRGELIDYQRREAVFTVVEKPKRKKGRGRKTA